MKNSVLLTIFSLLTILLLILHLTTEIAFGLESGGLKNIMGILVVVVWLSGTLLLYERKLGYVIVLVGSLLGTVVPIIHMMGAGLVGGRIGHTHLALFWVFSNFLLGVTALFSVILSAPTADPAGASPGSLTTRTWKARRTAEVIGVDRVLPATGQAAIGNVAGKIAV